VFMRPPPSQDLIFKEYLFIGWIPVWEVFNLHIYIDQMYIQEKTHTVQIFFENFPKYDGRVLSYIWLSVG
jgi:hypothetical protein